MIDHIGLTTIDNKEGKFSVVPSDDHCLENCSFGDTTDWYDEVLASISVFWGDSGMTPEGNFSVFVFSYKVFRLKFSFFCYLFPITKFLILEHIFLLLIL